MAGIGKDTVLFRQIGAAAIHQIQAGQPIFRRDFLGADVFLHRLVIERAALYRGVVGDHHTRQPVDHTDAGDDTGTGNLAAVLAIGRQRRQLQKRGARIHQQVDPVADQKFAALAVPVDHVGTSTRRRLGNTGAQGFDAFVLRRVVARVGFGCGQYCCFETRHGSDILLQFGQPSCGCPEFSVARQNPNARLWWPVLDHEAAAADDVLARDEVRFRRTEQIDRARGLFRGADPAQRIIRSIWDRRSGFTPTLISFSRP